MGFLFPEKEMWQEQTSFSKRSPQQGTGVCRGGGTNPLQTGPSAGAGTGRQALGSVCASLCYCPKPEVELTLLSWPFFQ